LVIISFSHTQFQLTTLNINKEHKTVESSKPVNYLTTRRSSMVKRQGSILSFFGKANGPTQQKTTKAYEY
jgi:hypothetical protein